MPDFAFDRKSNCPSFKNIDIDSTSLPYYLVRIFSSFFITSNVLMYASFMAKFLLSLKTINLSITFEGVALVDKLFRHLCTSELINSFVSADFFISFSNTNSISGSICRLKALISSLRHINAFFETLDLRL